MIFRIGDPLQLSLCLSLYLPVCVTVCTSQTQCILVHRSVDSPIPSIDRIDYYFVKNSYIAAVFNSKAKINLL